MTIKEAKTNIILWFANNDYFCIKEDFIKSLAEASTFLTENEEIEKKVYKCALEDFEKTEVCRKLYSQNKDWQDEVWVLEKKLAEHPQQVIISFPTANIIGGILDKCNKIQNIKKEKTTIYSISEQDIQDVCVICAKLLTEAIDKRDQD
jgi:hypothetical protein